MNAIQYILRDGTTLIVIHKPGFHSVSVVAGVAAGSNNETYGDEFGLAHAVEHMLFRGAYGYTRQQLTSDLVRQGCDTNAFTSYDSYHGAWTSQDAPGNAEAIYRYAADSDFSSRGMGD